MNETRCRKWQVTINNPLEKGYTHEKLRLILEEFKGLSYWCMSDEIGENGTYHTHIYIYFNDATRFSTLKNNFDGGHFEMCKGTSQQNRDYIFKEGIWANDKKGDTNLRDTHEEYGEMPIERQGARNDLADLYDMIKSGMTNFQILEEAPNYMLNVEKIDKARQIILEEKYKRTWRDLQVIYIYGPTGSGKTRSVMEEYGYENVYRVTDYEHPFDSYNCQDVIIFEEFRNSLKIQDMLNYLDGYPLELPCRYSNKRACFTKIFIISNWELKDQYVEIQLKYPETWRAFKRRIHQEKLFVSNGWVVNKIEYAQGEI